MATKNKEVRNEKNMIIGWCQEYPDRILATHFKKGYLGCYTKGTDTTTDRLGKIFCYGDGTSDLIRKADRESR